MLYSYCMSTLWGTFLSWSALCSYSDSLCYELLMLSSHWFVPLCQVWPRRTCRVSCPSWKIILELSVWPIVLMSQLRILLVCWNQYKCESCCSHGILVTMATKVTQNLRINNVTLNLKLVSYNMHRSYQGLSVVDELIKTRSPDVLVLQEHWLTRLIYTCLINILIIFLLRLFCYV